MANLKIVSRDEFSGLRWHSVSNFRFTARDSFCQLVLQELATACLHTPLALFERDSGFVPVSVQSLLPLSNLFVTDGGSWRSGYIPSPYRAYPFLLLKGSDENYPLAVDMDSGLIGTEKEGNAFFGDDGEPVKKLQEIMNFLSHVQADRERTAQVCSLLSDCNLIEPWPIVFSLSGSEQRVEGYHRIAEDRVNALAPDKLASLRDAGAFQLIYPQLISMQHLPRLVKLTTSREAAAQARKAREDFLVSDGNISFDSL